MTTFEIAILAVFAVMMLAVVIIAASAVGALKKLAENSQAVIQQPVALPRKHLEIGRNGIEEISDSLASDVAPAEMETFVPEGKLYLYDTTDREAAMVMAIVAEKTGIPLNRLRFESITKVEG